MRCRPQFLSRFVRCAGVAVLAVGGLTGPMIGAEKKVTLPRFTYPDALPALMAAATREKVNVLAREFPPEPRKAMAGDELTFVVSLKDGDRLKQWVLAAKTAELSEADQQLPPLKPYVRYTSTGTELKFEGRRAAIEMTLIGPMSPGQGEDTVFKPETKRRRLLVNADYLELGFRGAADHVLALREINAKRPREERFETRMGNRPFPPEEVKANQARAAELGLSAADERAFYGSVPALLEFFNLIMKTPGLRDILKEVIDVSWWSLLTNGGKTHVRLEYVSQRIQKLDNVRPDLPQYAFPVLVMVNEKPAMAVVLVVTEPRAPFATTAGVIAIHAGRPYDNQPQLTVRLVGSRYAGGTTAMAASRE